MPERLNGFQLACEPAVWSADRTVFHSLDCKWASGELNGVYGDAVRSLKAPCLACWGKLATPSVIVRSFAAMLREERDMTSGGAGKHTADPHRQGKGRSCEARERVFSQGTTGPKPMNGVK